MLKAGHLTEYVQVFRHSDTGTSGYQDPQWSRDPKAKSWYAERRQDSVRENSVGGAMQQVILTRWAFRVEARDALTHNGKIRHGSTWYSITGIRDSMYFDQMDDSAITVDSVQVSLEPAPETADVTE